jgi:hypothetical protein
MPKGMRVREAMELPGGGNLSIQASAFHYCSPRDDDGPYVSVEVLPYGCPDIPEAWAEYRDGDSGIYGYIPVDLVNAYIASRHWRGSTNG